jgi:zinc transport system ATP-binding protein
MMLIKINALDVKYGGKKVLQNLHLSLTEREIVTIVGPNGSGKTTLFKAIIGTAPISSGKVILKPNLKIGYVPQQLNIDGSLPLTVSRFLQIAQNNNGKSLKQALEMVGIEDILKAQISKLSGGQMQRVLLARAIVNQPDVLLLDEATRGLDQPGAAAFYRLIENIRTDTGCAVLMISHDLHVVMAASDRVICLNGHICCEGAPQTVATSPQYKALFGTDVDGAFALYQHSHNHNRQNEKV